MTTNAALMARRNAAVPRGIAHATTIFAARAENAEIWDVEGRRYVDFAGGIAVLNIGHRHAGVLAAIRDQLDRYTHTAFQVVPYDLCALRHRPGCAHARGGQGLGIARGGTDHAVR